MPNSGLDVMVDLDKFDDLNRLYRLFLMVPSGLPTLRRSFKDSILRRGREINLASTSIDTGQDMDDGDLNDTENTKGKDKGQGRTAMGPPTLTLALKWVQTVLDLKDKFDCIWTRAFDNNREVESSLNEVSILFIVPIYPNVCHKAFEDFINLNEKAPEYISLFIDENLKKGLKGVSNPTPLILALIDFFQKTDMEVDAVLDKTITVFRYITEKDAFERYYKNHLAKRLLLGRSVSDDAERGMLAKLKVECGYQFTQKLEGMFHDMKISADTMQAYRKYLEGVLVGAVISSYCVYSMDV